MIMEPAVVRRILDHLGLPTVPRRRGLAHARAPPTGLDGDGPTVDELLTELFQGKDFSRLPLYGMKTLPADAMVQQYGPPPARLGKLDLKDAWVAIADLGGHGYVAVFKKKYGRWVAVAYTD